MILNKENYFSQNSYENSVSSTNSNYFYMNQKTYYDNSSNYMNTRPYKTYPKNDKTFKYYFLLILSIVLMMTYLLKIYISTGL